MKDKTFIITALILTAVSIVALASYLPARSDSALKIKMADFPKEIGDWRAVDIPVSERDYQILETRNLIMRDYKNPKGESVYLYLIYSEDNRKTSHPPEVCYMGSGVTIVDKTAVQITSSIKANKLVVEKGDSRQLVVYWYKAGGLNTDKYLRQQIKIVAERTFGKRTSGALIRLSVDIKDNDQEAALNLIRSFCAQITPLLAQYVP